MSESQYAVSLERTANVPCSEGVHSFKIVSGTEEEGPKGPYWQFFCQPMTPGEEGKQVRMNISLTPQSRWKLEIFLDALQAPRTGTVTVEKFIGRLFRGSVVHGSYEGRAQAEIHEMFPINQAGKPATPPPAVTPVRKVTGQPTATAQEVAQVRAAQPKQPGLPSDAGSEADIPDFK